MLRQPVLALLIVALVVAGLVPATAGAVHVRATACTAPLTLRLAANRDIPFVQAVPVPPDMPAVPPGVIVVHVPRYPGANTTPFTTPMTPTATLTPTTTLLSIPLTPYLKTAVAIYRLPASPSTASAWYQRQFAQTKRPLSDN